MPPRRSAIPRIDIVGLGPAGPELITQETHALMTRGGTVFLRTARHPASGRYPDVPTFDHHYEGADDFAQVYESIVADLVTAARREPVVYAVPGSPSVAERTVALLREDPAVVDGEIELVVHASVSFVDLALVRLGVDPVAAGFRLVDGETFAVQAAGQRGPLLVAQCWNKDLLSDIKLAVESPVIEKVTVLFHLGLADEHVWDVSWNELDRSFDPDHLTSLWIPELLPPVGAELLALDELVHTLRVQCPWDREQTHGSLARHLLEESYEVLEAIDTLAALDALDTDSAVGIASAASAASLSTLPLLSTLPPLPAPPPPRATRRPQRGIHSTETRPQSRPPTRRPSEPSPTSRRSSAICSSRSTFTPCSEPNRVVSIWPMWPAASTTSWWRATHMSSAMERR